MSRWVHANHRPSARHRIFLEQLGELRHALQETFGADTGAMHAWLQERVPAFRGRTPMSLILSGRMDAILTALANLHGGVFV